MIAKGREYYVAPAYPMLYALGRVRMEAWLESLRSPWANILRRLVGTALVADIAIAAAVRLPLAPVNSAWFRTASGVNGAFQREEIGWPELVEFVAHIRDALPGRPEDRVPLGIL